MNIKELKVVNRKSGSYIVNGGLLNFYNKIMITPSCWLWTGSKNRRGYGTYVQSTGNMGAHRFAYTITIGDIPSGMQLDHLCRNTTCVRPDHLEPVTAQENVHRGGSPAARNVLKTQCPEGHPYSGDNLRQPPSGGRQCRICSNARNRVIDAARRKRKREARLAIRGPLYCEACGKKLTGSQTKWCGKEHREGGYALPRAVKAQIGRKKEVRRLI